MSKKKTPPPDTLPIEPIPAPVPPADGLTDVAGQETTVAKAEPVTDPVPEAWDAPEVLAIQENWPKSECTRDLNEPMTEDEFADAGRELAETIREIRRLEDQKKSANEQIKTLIGKQEATQDKLSTMIDRGTALKEVACIYVFGTRGRDDTGKFIRDESYKTLVRKDNGAVITFGPVTDADRQIALPLDQEKDVTLSEEVSKDAYNSAYDEGGKARKNNMSRAACPHAVDTDDRLGWLAGWDDQNDERSDEKEAA